MPETFEWNKVKSKIWSKLDVKLTENRTGLKFEVKYLTEFRNRVWNLRSNPFKSFGHWTDVKSTALISSFAVGYRGPSQQHCLHASPGARTGNTEAKGRKNFNGFPHCRHSTPPPLNDSTAFFLGNVETIYKLQDAFFIYRIICHKVCRYLLCMFNK